MTDSGPLVKIKQALSKLKMESSQMDVRIGVVRSFYSAHSHSLTLSSLSRTHTLTLSLPHTLTLTALAQQLRQAPSRLAPCPCLFSDVFTLLMSRSSTSCSQRASTRRRTWCTTCTRCRCWTMARPRRGASCWAADIRCDFCIIIYEFSLAWWQVLHPPTSPTSSATNSLIFGRPVGLTTNIKQE